MASTSPRCMAFRHATYRALIPDESLAPRAPALSVKCFYLLPNGLRLSGERSKAKRVRCSRGLGTVFTTISPAIEANLDPIEKSCKHDEVQQPSGDEQRSWDNS